MILICKNPSCGQPFEKIGRSQKFCCYRCGDKLRSKKYRDCHVSVLRNRRLEYMRTHKEELKIRHQTWSSKNKDYRREYMRKWYKKVGQRYINQYQREWGRKNRDRVKGYGHNRRSVKDSRLPPEHRLSKLEWECLLFAWDYKCAYCGKPDEMMTQDHVQPLSKGGSHTADNVIPACKSCNSKKHDREVGEFLLEIDWHP